MGGAGAQDGSAGAAAAGTSAAACQQPPQRQQLNGDDQHQQKGQQMNGGNQQEEQEQGLQQDDRLTSLSKEMAQRLRHDPPEGMDGCGFVPVDKLVDKMEQETDGHEVEKIVETDNKGRYQLINGQDGELRVRAVQGHSVDARWAAALAPLRQLSRLELNSCRQLGAASAPLLCRLSALTSLACFRCHGLEEAAVVARLRASLPCLAMLSMQD